MVDANPAASRLTGYSRDELLDQSFFALMPPECRPVVPEVFERLRADGVVQGEFRLRRKDGTMVVTDYRSSRVGPDRFRSVVRDVTERKRMGKTTAGDQPPLPGHASRAPTGLGLALVYGVVRRHGGTLSVASEVGNGTTVTMRLPIAPSVGKEPRPGTKPDSAGYAHVLVVDDEPAMREIVAIYLATDGHPVETAANGRAGLAMFQAGAFDVVVTDFAMPEVNGAELALAIKRERPDVPIIMLTGLGALIAAPNPAPPGVDLVLGKPIGAMALRNAMRQVLSREAGRFRPDRREVPSLSQASAAGVLAP